MGGLEPFVASGRVSGKIVPVAVVLSVVSGAFGAAVGALAGAMPLLGLGEIVALILAGLLLAALNGAALRVAIRAGHVRSRPVGAAVAIGSGGLAAGAALTVLVVVRGDLYGVTAALAPDLGTLAIFGLVAAPFVGVALVFAGRTAAAPYCESCGRWADAFEPVVHLARTPPSKLRRWIRAWDIEQVLTTPVATDQDDVFDVVEAARCPECTDFAAIRFVRVRWNTGSKQVAELMPPHVVARHDVDLLADLARETHR